MLMTKKWVFSTKVNGMPGPGISLKAALETTEGGGSQWHAEAEVGNFRCADGMQVAVDYSARGFDGTADTPEKAARIAAEKALTALAEQLSRHSNAVRALLGDVMTTLED